MAERITEIRISDDQVVDLTKLVRSIIVNGMEYGNPVPIEADVAVERPPTLAEQIKRVMVSQKMADAMEGEDDNALDFDIPDEEPNPLSMFEMQEMVEEAHRQPSSLSIAEGSEPSGHSPSPVVSPEPNATESQNSEADSE